MKRCKCGHKTTRTKLGALRLWFCGACHRQGYRLRTRK